MNASQPTLERLERAVDRRDYPQALAEVFRILQAIDSGYGRIHGVGVLPGLKGPSPAELHVHFATRFISAFGQLLVSPGFALNFAEFEGLQQFSRWIELMSSLSGHGSTDHFVRRLGTEGDMLSIDAGDILRFLALYMPHSSLDVPFDVLHHGNSVGFVVTALGWIGSRYCFNRSFFDLREKLLEWIVPRLEATKLGEIALANVAEPYFHCSYAITAHKHGIKSVLMRQLHDGLIEAGAVEWEPGAPTGAGGRKPVIVVTAEYINKGHSIHRTHSKSLRSLRRKFHVVLVCNRDHVAGISQDLYDELLPLPRDTGFFEGVVGLSKDILRHRPSAVLHMCVGMAGQIIALASLRLAPVQLVSYGHMATTMSPAIDYVVLPEDFVGAEDRFSEKVLGLPKQAMPYEPRTDVDFVALREAAPRSGRAHVEIAVPATLMKLNPVFFETLKRIHAEASTPCQFRFYPGFCVGLTHTELERQIRRHLPGATVNAELPYEDYCRHLARCDFTLSPFPYGNMNTVVESVALGLPGVCLDGPESHSRADGALYARLGLPACLNAATIEDYVKQAVRLIDDSQWLSECRALAASAPLQQALYDGDESLFCEAVYEVARPAIPRAGVV